MSSSVPVTDRIRFASDSKRSSGAPTRERMRQRVPNISYTIITCEYYHISHVRLMLLLVSVFSTKPDSYNKACIILY